jgi:DNA primase
MRHDRDAILARVDLEALADELLGRRPRPFIRMWPCPNPDHPQTGKTPPLSVFAARSGHQRWHCHGCGDGGTAIDLLLATRHAHDVRDALDRLAHRTGLTPEPPPDGRRGSLRPVPVARSAPKPPRSVDPQVVDQLDEYAVACAEHLRSPAGRAVLAWLTERRAIPPDVIDAAGLGADPGPRHLPRPDGVPRVFPAVVFPVRQDGHVVYTVSRHLRPVASRWWNTAERVAPNPRLAFYQPPGYPAGGGVVVTEGPLDALSALAAGYQAAAILGAGTITPAIADQLALTGHRLLLALDNDPEGRRAHDRLARLLTERSARWSALPIPAHHGDLNVWHTTVRDRWTSVMRTCDRLSSTIDDVGTPPPGVA